MGARTKARRPLTRNQRILLICAAAGLLAAILALLPPIINIIDECRARQGDEPPDNSLVYVTPTGKKYHRPTCKYVKNNSNAHPISLKQARASYDPCKVCNPP